MDSITQFALGATIGTVMIGAKTGPRKAALVGGLLATLPDLDVLLPFGDPIDNFTLHRGPSHSLLVQALASPIAGEMTRHFLVELRARRWLAWALAYLCFSTHALLDVLTVYGTRIFWPIDPYPYAVGSLFIIDPLYTISLLVITLGAFSQNRWTTPYRNAALAGLIISTGYALWSVAAQQIATRNVQAFLLENDIEPERIIVSPTPFNTMFWKSILIDGDRYINVYVPLLGGEPQAYTHDRGASGLDCLAANTKMRQLFAFAKGFIKIEKTADGLMVTDLRMGVTPFYVFNFLVAKRLEGSLQEIEPIQIRTRGGPQKNDWAWLAGGIIGMPVIRDVEVANQLKPARHSSNRAAAEMNEASC